MDSRINNNLSFKANLVTTLKGRNNILEPVAKEFARLTKNSTGELRLDRVKDRAFYSKGDHLLSVAYNNVDIYTTKLHKLLSIEPEKVDNKVIKAVAKEFAGIFHGLELHSKHIEKVKKMYETYTDAKASAERLTFKQKYAQKIGGCLAPLAKRFGMSAEKHNKTKNEALEYINKSYKTTLAKLDKYDSNILGEELKFTLPEVNDLAIYI